MVHEYSFQLFVKGIQVAILHGLGRKQLAQLSRRCYHWAQISDPTLLLHLHLYPEVVFFFSKSYDCILV